MTADDSIRPNPLDEPNDQARAGGGLYHPMDEQRMHVLTEHAISQGRRRRAHQLRQRRFRKVATGIGVAIVVTMSSALAAAMIWREQPTAPQAGIVCRAEPSTTADAIVLETDDDPIALCQSQWDKGAFRALGTSTVPNALVACISTSGTIDVFPGDETLCPRLGLAVADTGFSDHNHSIIELQHRLVEEVNAVDCLTTEQAVVRVRRILTELSLTDWTVQINADAVGADCAKANIGSDNEHVYIQRL